MRVRGIVTATRVMSAKLIFVSLREAPAPATAAARAYQADAERCERFGNVTIVAPGKSYEPSAAATAAMGGTAAVCAPSCIPETELQAVAMSGEVSGASACAEACRGATLLRNDDVVVVTGVAGLTKRGHFSIFAQKFDIEVPRLLQQPRVDV